MQGAVTYRVGAVDGKEQGNNGSKLAEQKKNNVHCMSSNPPCKVLMCRPFLFKLQIAINNNVDETN